MLLLCVQLCTPAWHIFSWHPWVKLVDRDPKGPSRLCTPSLGRARPSRGASPVTLEIHITRKDSGGRWASCPPAESVVGTSWSSHLLWPRSQLCNDQPSIRTRSWGPSVGAEGSCQRCEGEGLGSKGGGAIPERKQAAKEWVISNFQA